MPNTTSTTVARLSSVMAAAIVKLANQWRTVRSRDET
jgi:hypothetical protein